ncbi:TrmH family RNA methyltransferase [Candidatus Parcubacteria bacterium]|nr:TrmH family RNA methyltransferase [Candidatus Parcubacteria bacterium]
MKTAIVVLDNIRSVENTASIFRTAESLGVAKIILVGTTPAPLDRFGRKRKDFAKVSLGAEDMVEWEFAKEIKPVIENLKSDGFQIVALEQDERGAEFKISDSFALILGNEVDGVSKEALGLADKIYEIPMKGKKESLNVSVAAGIALHELLK